MGPEVERRVIESREGLDQCRADAQLKREIEAKRRQHAHAPVAIGTRDERVFAGPFGWRGRVIAALGGGPNRGGWRGEAATPGVMDGPGPNISVWMRSGATPKAVRPAVRSLMKVDGPQI